MSDLPSWSLEDCRRQIETREELLGRMVGSLYPRIIADEIAKIEERVEQLENDARLLSD